MSTRKRKQVRSGQEKQNGETAYEDLGPDAQAPPSPSPADKPVNLLLRNDGDSLRCEIQKRDSSNGRHSHGHGTWWWTAFAVVFLLGSTCFVVPSVEEARMQVLSNVRNVTIWQTMNGTFWDRFDLLNSALADLAAQLPAFNLSSVLPTQNATLRVGAIMAEQGYKAKHPVIIIPGFITSGLEVWQGTPCGKKYFRQRMWGTLTMMQTFLRDTQCWLEHMSLDPVTGLDPEGIKLRAVVGLEAVDYFIQGYWVWGKLIETLAEVGYDNQNLISMSYDWRLGLPLLEQRDGYYTRLRNTIEVSHQLTGLKVAIVSHSMGDVVFRNFLHWMEEVEPGWVEEHITAWANIGGLVLGVPSAFSSLLSGEMMVTAHLEGLSAYLTNSIVPRQARQQLWRSWGSSLAMLPFGGPAIWGNTTWAPDDDEQIRKVGRTYGAIVASVSTDETRLLHERVELNSSEVPKEEWGGLTQTLTNWFTSGSQNAAPNFDAAQYLDVDSALSMLGRSWGEDFWRHAEEWSALRFTPQEKAEPGAADGSKKKRRSTFLPTADATQSNCPSFGKIRVRDPLHTPLPIAPSLHMVCMYGVGKPTERGYHYLGMEAEVWNSTGSNSTKFDEEMVSQFRLNTAVSDPESGLEKGVQLTDGDGTVPLISLGLMCRKGWQNKPLNPSGMKVTTREYQHAPSPKDSRGAGASGDHVDILGNDALLVDIVKLVTGNSRDLEDNIISRIDEIAAQVDFSEFVPEKASC